jgi:flagellar hook-associated protein 2
MSLGSVSFSGLSSGVDWRSMIDQLIKVDHKRVELVSSRKSTQESKLKAWQDLTGKLQALKSAAEDLRKAQAFNVFKTSLSSSSSTSASEILVASTDQYAVPGTHEIQVLQTAQAQKLSSQTFSSRKEALGGSYAGSLLIGGKLLTIEAQDTLESVRDKINSLNRGSNASGVWASIVSYSSTDHRLILTSQNQGSQGMDLRPVGETDLLAALGFTTSSSQIKNPTSSGARSANFSSSTSSISSLLGLTGTHQGTVSIGGEEITLDLSSSLSQIASQIDALSGVSARVVSQTGEDGVTTYRLEITGTTSFVDQKNVLHALGVLSNSFGSLQEIQRSDTALSKVGGGTVTASSTWSEVDTGGGANNITDGDTITITGTKHDGTQVSAIYTIQDKGTETLQGLLDAIEAAFGDVTASITAEGKIQVTDNLTGASALAVTLRSNNEGGGDLDLGSFSAAQKGYTMEVATGRDALLSIDGGYVTQSSNTVYGVIPGVTLDLLKAEQGTTITLRVERDLDSLVKKFKDFTEKYNAVMDFITAQTKYDEKNQKTGGVLFGDGTLSSVKSELMANLVSKIWGVSEEFSIPAMVGIKLDNKGKLSIEESTLRGYLSTNFQDVQSLFGASGTTSTGSLRYVSYGINTKPGTYSVNITQAAARASVTGTTDLSGGLSGDESLTIRTGGSSARVNLSSGMSLAEMVAAINEELKATYAEVLVGDAGLYRDAAATQPLTDTTTWAEVYDSSGQSAGLQSGDVISFSGTDRRGRIINGTYTISDVNTDTVRGLLSAIENAYGNQVVAAMDSSGRITLTDRTVGPSSLSLSVTGPPGRNLSFGTIDVDPTGADGSKEGRYALPIEASASADGRHLVITHSNYGSAESFSLEQENDLVLGAGLDGDYAGTDVSGTINGEAATGKGRTLRGNSGQANVDGLTLIYTGTETGEVGSVTLTLGVAEGFYRSLFRMVDAFEGYITNKQDSLQSYIERLGEQIQSMEEQLERKRVAMTSQFIQMEKVISKLQSQMSWLGQQISALRK